MTESEARAAAIADGIKEEQITPQILAYYGHIVPNPTAGLQVGAVIVPEQVKADLAALEAERKANALPTQIIGTVTSLLGWAKESGLLKIMGVLLCCAMLAGCGQTVAARKSVDQIDTSIQALNNQHLAFEDRMIKEFEAKELAQILRLDAEARQSSMKTVTELQKQVVEVPVKLADGTDAYRKEERMVSVSTEMIPANIAEALDKKKARLLTNMSVTLALMRSQQAKICENAAVAAMYVEGLRAYFEQRQSSYETMVAAQGAFQQWVELLVLKTEKKE